MSGFKILILSGTVFLLFDIFWLTTAQDKICSEEYERKLNAVRTKLNMLREGSAETESKLAGLENRCCEVASNDESSCTSNEKNELEEVKSKYDMLISDLLDVDGGVETHLMNKYCHDPPPIIKPPITGECPKVEAVQSDLDMLTEAMAATQSTFQAAMQRMMSLLKKTEADLALVKGQCCMNECPAGSGKLNPDGTRVCVDGCKPICDFFVSEDELLWH